MHLAKTERRIALLARKPSQLNQQWLRPVLNPFCHLKMRAQRTHQAERFELQALCSALKQNRVLRGHHGLEAQARLHQ